MKKGQTLFVIDQVPYRAAVETAKAAVQSAEAKVATARMTLKSKKELRDENIVSDYDYDTARLALDEAQAGLNEARAALVNAQNDLSYTTVKSPVDGVASMIPYRVGALVNSSISEPLVTVSDDHVVDAYFSMTENQVLELQENHTSVGEAIEAMPDVGLILSNGNPADGYSSGQSIEAIREVAKQTLPEGYGFEFGGMSREEAEGSGSKTALVFLACTIFIYLILCALYESVCIPLAVIFSVPFGLAGSFLFAKLFGIENNIYMQTGIIMLIGLLAKTAILLTEYASDRHKAGMSAVEAAKDAARVRLRPILMTSLTMIFGLLPMVTASGAGANGDRSLAVGTVGGMLIGTISLLFVVPVLYVVMQKIQDRMPKLRSEAETADDTHVPGRSAVGKTTNVLLMAIASTLLLTNCGIYNKVEPRQELTGMEQLIRTDSIGLDTSADTVYWEKLFIDPMLQSLIHKGLDNNHDLQVALLKVTEAEASLRTKKLSYLPSLGIDAQGQIKKYGQDKSAKSYSIGPSASWELDAFGSITNAKRYAQTAVEGQKAYAQAVKTRLIADIADTYYTLLLLDRQLEIDQTTLSNWERNIHILEVLKRNGQSDEIAISQAKADKLALEKDIESMKKSILDTENTLCTLLGETTHTVQRGTLAGMDEPLSVFGTSLSGISLEALHNRPDVRQAEYVLQQAAYNTQAARIAFYPAITLSGSLGWTNSGGSGITNPGDWLWNALASLTQPLFQRGELTANLRISKAQQEEALHAFYTTLLAAGEEANAAVTQWQTALNNVETDKQRVALMQKTVHLTEVSMRNSSINYLEVLTAQQSLLAAQNDLAQDFYDAVQAVINLYHALGGQ